MSRYLMEIVYERPVASITLTHEKLSYARGKVARFRIDT